MSRLPVAGEAPPADAPPADALPADALPADALPADALPADALPASTLAPGAVPAGAPPHSTTAGLVADLAASYARRRPVGSIAVVGNKPMDADPARAAAIDAVDLVVRVNGFRLDDGADGGVGAGWPGADGSGTGAAGGRAYGSRADVVVFNRALRATPWFFAEYTSRLYLLVEPGRLHWEPEEVPAWWPVDLGQVHLSNDDLTLPLSADLGLPTHREGLWATTGTMAAWWAARAFPGAHLLLSGFSFVDDPTQTRWAHASGDDCVVGAEHRIAAEAQLLRRWEREGRAELLR